MSRPAFRDALAQRVLVADGAMGTMLQRHDLTLDDFEGHEGCNEILNVTRPDVVRGGPRRLLRGGRRLRRDQHLRRQPRRTSASTASPTGSTSSSEAGARLAREAADALVHARTGPRWVLGSIGPGHQAAHPRPRARSPSCATPTSDNAAGLIAGGADALLIETCQDLLQAKAAVIGAKRAIAAAGRGRADHRPGDRRDQRHDAARLRDRRRAHRARAARRRRDRPQLRHRPRRDERAPALPRQALPAAAVLHAQRRPARAHRRRRPLPAHPRAELADAHDAFAREYGLALVGGCCGTTPEHMRRWSSGCAAASRAPRARARSPARPRSTSTCRSGRTPRTSPSASAPTPTAPRRSARRCSPGTLGRLRRDRPRPGPRRRAHARPVRRLRRPRRRRRHEGAGVPVRHRVHAADHARLHRARGAPGRAGDARRPLR